MTDKQTLLAYRLKQSEETLSDAEKMMENRLSPRSIINRAYYAVFYSILALFLSKNINIKTSKHAGIISIFDKEFIHTNKIDKGYSKILHKLFEARQEGDYKELAEWSIEDAGELIGLSRDFLKEMKKVISEGKDS